MVKIANSSSSSSNNNNKVFPSSKQEGGRFFEIAMEKFCFNLVSEEVLMRANFHHNSKKQNKGAKLETLQVDFNRLDGRNSPLPGFFRMPSPSPLPPLCSPSAHFVPVSASSSAQHNPPKDVSASSSNEASTQTHLQQSESSSLTTDSAANDLKKPFGRKPKAIVPNSNPLPPHQPQANAVLQKQQHLLHKKLCRNQNHLHCITPSPTLHLLSQSPSRLAPITPSPPPSASPPPFSPFSSLHYPLTLGKRLHWHSAASPSPSPTYSSSPSSSPSPPFMPLLSSTPPPQSIDVLNLFSRPNSQTPPEENERYIHCLLYSE